MPRASSPPKQCGCQVEHIAVDQTLPVERRGERGSTFDHELQHTTFTQLVEQLGEAPGPLERRVDPGCRRGSSDDDSQRVTHLCWVDPLREVPHRQRWVIGAYRAGPDGNGIAGGAQEMRVGPGLLHR